MIKIASNKKATFEYFILEKFEGGLCLLGSEIKSIRMGKVNLKDSYLNIQNGEVFLLNMHISDYDKSSTIRNHEPLRPRKVLLHKKEINKLLGQIKEKGLTLIPLELYILGNGKCKVSFGLCKGKALHDKRQTLKEKEAKRDIDRSLRERNR